LKSDGTVWAWGDNYFGELGNGTNTNSNVPVQVSGLTGVTAIAGGGYHSLALKSDGTVWAWGDNADGQLGNGTLFNINVVPVPVSGLTEITAIAGGGHHSLALNNDGTVWAWGSNDSGQLGNGTNTDSNVPVQVSGLTGITAIAAGWDHSLALKNGGTVWAWGHNGDGELGDGTNYWSNVPVQVSGLTGITKIAGGHWHSLALKNDGTVWAWGYNNYGQLGNGTNTNSNLPVQVSGLTGVTAIAGCVSYSLALKDDGTVWAWGYNADGELGNGTNTDSYVPVQVVTSVGGPALTGITAIAGGYAHSLALKSDGTVWAWGYNWNGQLGNGTNTDSYVPVQVVTSFGGPALTGVTAIAGGYHHCLALKSEGTVWAWGYNGDGELGNGTKNRSNVPVQVSGLTGITAIAGGGFHSLAIYPFVPNEIAPGSTFNTAQKWTGKNTQTWPGDASAASYRLYRGVKAGLPYLLDSRPDSCLRYEGSSTSTTISDDPTNLGAGDFYWYLVVGVQGPAEGPAGNATAGPRIVNSSGLCPQ
jgi:alpha-tubulin suppressor-like RCC1 family protein